MRLTPCLRILDPDRANVRTHLLDGESEARFGLKVELTEAPCSGGIEVRAEFTALRTSPEEWQVGLCAVWPNAPRLHVAAPAMLYDGNRFRSQPFPYPCIISEPEDFRADLPNTISNVARLPRAQWLVGDAAMPAVGIGDFDSGEGAWLFTDPDADTMFEAVEEHGQLRVSLFRQGVRFPTRYHGCGHEWLPSDDQGWRPSAGDQLVLRVHHLVFEAKEPADLYRVLFEHRHDLWRPGGRHELPWSAAFEIQQAKYNRENWDPEREYYAVGDRKSRYAHWQIGWVGGGISSHALQSAGDPETRARAIQTLDWMADRGQSPSGFYWSVGIEDDFFSDMVDMEWGHDWHLIRRSGDALYFFCKQVWLAGEVRENWRESIRKCADAFVRLWEREGQFGQFVSQETGEIRVGRTASGAIAPAGLALAARLLGNSRYLEVAEESARFYVREFLDRGYTSGGPGEASQCPDSESAFGLLESLVTLYEETGDRAWIPLAEKAAWLAASWVMPYDFAFPPESSFGRLDMRTTGTVWANVQNKHSAPGICTLSGVSLLKLYRATGEKRYLELCAQIGHAISQYLSRADRPVFGMPEGWMCERVNTSDWERPQTPVGEGFPASCWCEAASLLTFAELPGVYVQPDSGLCVALDHVDASLSGSRLSLFNPTAFDAEVKVMAESASAVAQALGQDFARNLPRVRVPAGGRVEFELA